MAEWIDRETALAKLGVRQQTLYAYVSRGRIGRRIDPLDPRRSLYRADDVAALKSRRDRGRRPAAIAASVFSWGEPSIASTLSTVINGQLVFRGQDAAVLAETAALEDIAALMWDRASPVVFAEAPEAQPDVFRAVAGLIATARPALGRSREAMCSDAAAVVATLAAALGARGDAPRLHERLGRAWGLEDDGIDLLRMAMVLQVDHELNPSTFAARVTASTGGSIAASILAGLCALSGPRHGAAGVAVMDLVQHAERSGAEAAVAHWLEQERPLPGFGHALYPDGDPRGTAMLARFELDDAMAALRAAAFEATGALANCDFALAALTRHLALPDDAPFRLFAIARSIGWGAHAMEQIESGQIIRPRARYEGVALPA